MGPRATRRHLPLLKEPMPRIARELRAEICGPLRAPASEAPGASIRRPSRTSGACRRRTAPGLVDRPALSRRRELPHRDKYGPTGSPRPCVLSRRGEDYGAASSSSEERPRALRSAASPSTPATSRSRFARLPERDQRRAALVELKHGTRPITRESASHWAS
jgi:hypothetical protein